MERLKVFTFHSYSDFWNLNVTKHKSKSFTNMAVKPGSNSFYEISAILASFAKSDDFFPGVLPIMGYTGREALPERGTFFRLVQPPPKCSWPRNDPQPLNDPQFDPEMTPIPKWSPCLFTSTPKWSPVNSWNGMVFHHWIITSLLHRLRSWIAFNISLNYVIFWGFRHLIAFMSTFASSISY